MNIIAGVVSVGVGICVLIQARKWFFGSNENFWKSFGSGFDPSIFPRNRDYQKYYDDKKGQLTIITWLMTGTLSSLLSYALLNLLFF